MAVKKKPTATRWSDGTVPLEELAPNGRLAHELVSERGDLTPSVERIMSADLTEDERNLALTWFRESLGRTDDPNRDPRTAIANAVGSA